MDWTGSQDITSRSSWSQRWVGLGRLVMALEGVVYSRTWPALLGEPGKGGRERKREEREEKINTVGLVLSSRFSPPSYRIVS